MAKIPLKAAGAFVWSLMVKAMKKTETIANKLSARQILTKSVSKWLYYF